MAISSIRTARSAGTRPAAGSMSTRTTTTIILETAHPAKFPEVMDRALGPGQVAVPERLACLANEPKVAVPMAADSAGFTAWLLETA